MFTSTESRHVREVVTSSREGGPSLNILSGLVAGNFSAYWLGMTIMVPDGDRVLASARSGLGALMVAPAVFAFGLVAFGFLGMGPVTIAVDSYGPVTDNAQSVFELSTIEQIPDAPAEIQREYGFARELREGEAFPRGERRRGQHVQGDGEAGAHRHGRRRRDDDDLLDHRGADARPARPNLDNLSLLHPPFLLGLITGGAIIYWFTGASMQAVTTGAYRAVEFIKANMNLDEHRGGVGGGLEEGRRDLHASTRRRACSTSSSTVFFATLAFAFVEPYFFIGYLISIALFGLYQAIFMANAGGAWDNAKKIVEVELKQKGTPLHAATVVGDTVGDPFKDTSSVALNPIIKFTTLFGLLAVELAVSLTEQQGPTLEPHARRGVLPACSLVFVYRSFYGMRIESEAKVYPRGDASPPLERPIANERDPFSPENRSPISKADIAHARAGLKRTLGKWHLTALGVGATIGAGIFATTGTAIVGDAARPGAGPGDRLLVPAHGRRVRLRGTVLRRVRGDGAGRRVGVHVRVRVARRVRRVDHRLGPDRRVRGRQHRRRDRVGGILPRVAQPFRDRLAGLALHGLPVGSRCVQSPLGRRRRPTPTDAVSSRRPGRRAAHRSACRSSSICRRSPSSR